MALTLFLGTAAGFCPDAAAVDYMRTNAVPVPSAPAQLKGYGTAFAVAAGLLVTNEHVVRGMTYLVVTDSGTGRRTPATVVGADAQKDLALVRAAVDCKPLPLAPSEATLQPGLAVFSVGYPAPLLYGFDRKLSQGHVQLLRMPQMPQRFTADLGVRGGDSGSPVFTAEGQVVGAIAGGFAEPVIVNGAVVETAPIAAGVRLDELRSFLQQYGVTPQGYRLRGSLEAVAQTVAPSVLLVEVGN
jgi:S1-C subfamily serine protease